MFTYKYFILIFFILIFLLPFYTPTVTYPISPSLPFYSIYQVYCPLILSHHIDFDKHIFDTIDDIVLGDIVNNDSILLSEFYFIGRSILSTIMCTTPNCLRINIENRKKQNNGYIYFEYYDTLSSDDEFILNISSLLCIHIFHFDITDILLNYINSYPFNNKLKLVQYILNVFFFYNDRILMASFYLHKYKKIQFNSFFYQLSSSGKYFINNLS